MRSAASVVARRSLFPSASATGASASLCGHPRNEWHCVGPPAATRGRSTLASGSPLAARAATRLARSPLRFARGGPRHGLASLRQRFLVHERAPLPVVKVALLPRQPV